MKGVLDMFKNIKFTIRMKLITFFVLVGLIPALIIGLLSVNQARDNIQNEVIAKNEMYGQFMSQQIKDFFEQRRANVMRLANTTQIYEGLQILHNTGFDFNAPEWQAHIPGLTGIIEQNKADYEYEIIYMTDNKGIVVYSSDSALQGVDVSNRNYIQDAFKGETKWSEFAYSSLIDLNFLAAGSPVYGANNQLLGTISVVVDGKVIDDAVHQNLTFLGETADSYMITADGLLLTNTMQGKYSENATLKETLTTNVVKTLAPEIRAENYAFLSNIEYDDYEGNPVIGAVSVIQLGDTPAGLVSEIYQSEAYRGVDMMRNFMLIVLVITVPLVIAVGFWIASSFARPILKMQEVLGFVGQNDLRVKATVTTSDEIGTMAEDLNSTIDQLNDSLNRVKQAVENVSHGSEEIAAGNQDLSQRTEEQASALEEIASTIEEITSSMEASSSNAIEADNLSKRTLQTVQEGEHVVANLQESMVEITKGSREISEIIATVNDIAFQTNLLALNAAVEAARAGEQGRGFAVVASEVRNLAGRSAEAAKEIEKLIKNSIEKVDRGNEQMQDTQRVLNAIVDNTKKTTDVVGEISASLREQTLATTDIRKAIEELNQVTQQNASLVEEIASSSENMSSEAMELSKLVSVFKLDADSHSDNRPVFSAPAKAANVNSAKAKKLQATKLIASAKKDSYKKDTYKKDKFESDEYDFNEQDFEKF